MPARGEQPSQTPIEERLRAGLEVSVMPLMEHLTTVGEPHIERISAFMDGATTNGTVLLWGTERYEQDTERAGANDIRRPFGIEMETLSPSVRLILYPSTVYKADDEQRTIAKEEGFEIKEEGPQTMVYFLNEFEREVGKTPDFTANLLFTSHMIGAALEGRYPLETGEKSEEFLSEVRGALSDVRDYVAILPPEQRASLSPVISEIGQLDDEKLALEAKRRVLFGAEAMKAPGLFESGQLDEPLTPEQAVQNGEYYLKVGERNLPRRRQEGATPDVPSEPWKEYGTNRWNRSHQLFGRYETPIQDGALNVDFRLDSTHMPALYGFFDTIELTRITTEGIEEHILFGQEMGDNAALNFAQFFGAKLTPEQLQDSVIPIIIAGDFDFSNPETREMLGRLASDEGVKPDVGRVIADVLRLSAEDRLRRLQVGDDSQG